MNINQTPYNLVPQKWGFDGKIGPFIRELLEQNSQLRSAVMELEKHIAPGFWAKPKNEPIFLVFSGQSNCGGIGDLPNQIKNPRVFDYSTDGSGGALAWRSPDPNAAAKADYNPADPTGYTGMYLGGKGNIGWACADYLQRATGRDVYMVTVWRVNTGIDQWLTGGDLYDRWTDDVAAAQATPQINGRNADIAIWMQGEYDNAMGPGTYADKWLELYQAASAWNLDRFTQWVICEPLPSFHGAIENLRTASDQLHEYVSTANSALTTDVGLGHFDGPNLRDLGYTCARKFMAGPILAKRSIGWKSYGTVSTADATFTEIFRRTINDTNTLQFQAHIYGVRTDSTDAYGVTLIGIAQRDGTLAVDESTQWSIGPSLDARATADGNDLVIEVQGAASQDWDWEMYFYYQYAAM